MKMKKWIINGLVSVFLITMAVVAYEAWRKANFVSPGVFGY